MMRRQLPVVAVLAALATPASAGAATVLGPPTLDGTPDVACASNAAFECSLTQLEGPSEATITAPSGGVVTAIRLKHAAFDGVDIPVVKFLVLEDDPSAPPLGLRLVQRTGDTGLERTAGVETFRFRGAGLPVAKGQRIGLHTNAGAMRFEVDEPAGGGWISGFKDGPPGIVGASSQYAAKTEGGRRLLLQADLEPDADGDGFGDETQDNCPSVANDQTTNPCAPQVEQPQTGQQPGVHTAQPVEPFVAAPVAPYVAPTIERLPARTYAYDELLSGLTFAYACGESCSWLTSIYLNAGWALAAQSGKPRRVLVGRRKGTLAAGGRARVKVRLTAKGRRLVQRARRRGGRATLTIQRAVTDSKGTRRATQKVKVAAKRR